MNPADALAALARTVAAAQPAAERSAGGEPASLNGAAGGPRELVALAVEVASARGGFLARVEAGGLRVVATAGAPSEPPPLKQLERVAVAVREALDGVSDAPPVMTGGAAAAGAVAVKAEAGHPPVHALPLLDPSSGDWEGVLALIPSPAARHEPDATSAAVLTVLRGLATAWVVNGVGDGDPRSREGAAGGELKHVYDEIITRSPKVHAVLRKLDRVIGARVPVLIAGETGTGKELIARAIHRNDPHRRRKRFYTQNCGAIPGSLLESELFGYEKGAFTGAERRKEGLFEIASGSTLFLDEIAEMSLDMQTRLLRVLQEGEVVPLGSAEPVKVDVRIVAATHRDLEAAIKAGSFREDLYYRLKVVRLGLPPLRDRPEDIPLLVDHFLRKTAREMGKRPKVVDRRDPRIFEALTRHRWPGNIRELENLIRRLAYLADDVITYDALVEADAEGQLLGGEEEGGDARPVRPLDEVVEEVERREIENALRVTQGNRTRAADLLGINRRSLLRRLAKYDGL